MPGFFMWRTKKQFWNRLGTPITDGWVSRKQTFINPRLILLFQPPKSLRLGAFETITPTPNKFSNHPIQRNTNCHENKKHQR